MEPLGSSVIQGADVVGATRQMLSNVVLAKSGISPKMVIRLSKAFGSTPETWLHMQLAYGLTKPHKQADGIQVEQYQPEAYPLMQAKAIR